MEQEILKKARWESTVSERVSNASADQIWLLLKDFFGIHKYFPVLSSYGIHGNNGEVGSIRYCEGVVGESPQEGGTDDEKPLAKWTKEKILAIDPTQRSLTYELIDGNVELKSCVSTMKVLVMNADQSGGGDGGESPAAGCVLEWSFSVDPVEGFQFEDLVKLFQVWVQYMAQKMEASLVPGEN